MPWALVYTPRRPAGRPREEAMSHVLVVDDNADARELLATMLRTAGYDVSVAADGREGLERYAELRPSLVLADIFMPGMDGIGMIREIRREFPDARIIAM